MIIGPQIPLQQSPQVFQPSTSFVQSSAFSFPQFGGSGGLTFFDPRYQTWDHWSALMAEGFAEQGLPINVPESQWLDWGLRFISFAELAGNSIVDPRVYPTWQSWAEALLLCDLKSF